MAFLDDPAPDKPKSETEKPAKEGLTRDWKKFFDNYKGKMPPKEIQSLVTDLNAEKKYEDVIALLEQAIIHGQIQPWMYEVLALNMEVVGRPRAQIERVILSSLDFINDDPDAILHLAAYLTKFERYQQALRLYRRVAVLEPLRMESYAMGLGIAEKLEDPVAAMWIIPGVLTRAWGKDHQDLQERAERLSQKVVAQLKESGRALEAAALEQLTNSARQRDLHVTLDWNGNGDLDLEVVDPTGAVCLARQPASPGGVLHIRSGQGPRQEDCVEEIVAPVALPGEYRIRVKHQSGDIVGKRARLTILRHEGTPRETKQVQTIPLDKEGQTVRVLLKGGRLTAPLTVPVAPTTARRKAPRPPTGVRQLPDATARGNAPGPTGAGFGAVGFQPVVEFVPSGVQLAALAVISGDRRYVRISTSPMFTNITDVFTFSFTGGVTGPGAGNF